MQTKDFYALSPSLKTKDAVECESFVNKLLSFFLGIPGPRDVISKIPGYAPDQITTVDIIFYMARLFAQLLRNKGMKGSFIIHFII